MESQIENAIEIAWNPTPDQNLKEQAFLFLSQIRDDPASWQPCLAIFAASPRRSDIVRHFCLEILNNAVLASRLDSQALDYMKSSLVDYVRQTYSRPGGQVDTAHIQNKLIQTLTYLFAALYPSNWQSFFDDFRALAGDAAAIGIANVTATKFYLRVLRSVHDEIADVLVPRTPEANARHTELKDLIRARDAGKIAASWQEILGKWQQAELSVVELCLRTVSAWISWVDITLVVNESMISILLQMAGQQTVGALDSPQAKVRDAAIDTFTETVGKKMRPPEKIELITALNLGNVVGELIRSPSLAEQRSTSHYDTELAETVARLVNTIMTDIVKVLDAKTVDEQTKERADQQLRIFMPFLIRFFADEYDEICETVIPSLDELLTFFRKLATNPNAQVPTHYSEMLTPTLDAIIMKSRYDDTAVWGGVDDEEGTDEAEFQELRKRLHNLQLIIAVVDEPLYINVLTNVVATTFKNAESKALDWRDLELALHEMYLFGELAVKHGGLYTKRESSSVAGQRLVEMMTKMVESELASHPHPSIKMQYMETCVRYCQFFEQNTALIPRVLENFVRLTHSEHVKVRTRSWYLFLRFVKPLRGHLGNVSATVIQAIGDLLVIKAEMPDDKEGGEDRSSKETDDSADARFDCQLNLFEAIGCLSSAASVPVENRVLYAQSVINPLFVDIENHLGSAKGGDRRAILQIHHDIMALGTLARGFSDWQPTTSGTPAPSEVGDDFARAAEVILIALEALKSSMDIRSAARFAFARMIGVLGARVLQQLPRWIDGLVSHSSTNDEMVTFLRLLGQVIFAFKGEIQGVLDTLFTPLLQRIYAGLAEPVTGTDDEIQITEIRREYLQFLMLVLTSDLGSIVISPTNQGMFETVITSVEHFSRNTDDYANARLAIGLITRMIIVWGGPDVARDASSATPSPLIPGFDNFVLTRFSPLSWAMPANPNFKPRDPIARQVLGEVALMQLQILKKTGAQYLETLKTQLQNMGVDEAGAQEYLRRLMTSDERAFKIFVINFITKARSG